MEGAVDGGADGIDEVIAVAEADFALGGVDVDIDFFRREVDEEDDDGAVVADGPCFAEGVLDLRGGGGAAVDKDVLLGGAAADEVRL